MKVKENTIILVDYDNVFITLENNYRDFQHKTIMYDVITKIRHKYASDNILCFKLFADFQKIIISDIGYGILKQCNVEIEHVFGGKNAADVTLMLTCMKMIHQYPHVEKFVLISSDSDMMPIFKEIQLADKKLDVIYSGVNASIDYISHIQNVGINNTTIESVLGLEVAEDIETVDELYQIKTKNKLYFQQLLQHVNDAIYLTYDKYLRTNWQGDIVSVGSASAATITTYLSECGVCPERELKKNSGHKHCIFISMLLDKGILMYHEYKLGRKILGTYILSEQYLDDHKLYVDGLIKKCDYPELGPIV